jgi:hypothetical protein
VVDGEIGETAEQGAETRGPAFGLRPRLRAHPKLADGRPNHRIAEDQRPLSREPQCNLIGALDINHPQSVKELVAVADRVVKVITRATIWMRPRPDGHGVAARYLNDAAL